MFLFPCVALGIDAPVFATQSAHQTKRTELIAKRGVEGMQILLVDEAVEEQFVLRGVSSVKRRIVHIRFLRCVLARKIAVIASFYLEVLGHLVLIFEFQFLAVVVDILRTILIAVRSIVYIGNYCRILIPVVAIHLPTAQVGSEVNEVLVVERVAVVELAVAHVHTRT